MDAHTEWKRLKRYYFCMSVFVVVLYPVAVGAWLLVAYFDPTFCETRSGWGGIAGDNACAMMEQGKQQEGGK